MYKRIYFFALFLAMAASCGKINRNSIQGLRLGSNSVAISKLQSIEATHLLIATKKHSEKSNNKQRKKHEPVKRNNLTELIVSPAPQYDIKSLTYQVDAATGGSITYEKTGSTINIPADCLVDKNGNPVTGNVNIEYREFHTAKEIFFSGIPMHYDVNGERQYFESAGMLEINASQNNEEVFIKKGKEISFKMSTDNTNEGVMLYELDKEKKEWKEISKPNLVTTPIKNNIKKQWLPVNGFNIIRERKRNPLQVYIQDYEKVYDKKKMNFNRQISIRIWVGKNLKLKTEANRKDYKNANYLNGAIFVIEGVNKTTFKKMMKMMQNGKQRYNGTYHSRIDADVEITEVLSPNKVNLEFSFGEQKFSFEAKLNPRAIRSKKMKKKIFDIITNFPINNFEGRFYNHETYETCIDHYDSMFVDQKWYNSSIIQREFSSRDFGFLNCDQPLKLPSEMIVNAAFNVNDRKTQPDFVTLVDTKKNCLFSYYPYKYNEFGFNPESDNFIYTVFKDGTVGYITPEEFKKIQNSGKITIPFYRVTMQDFAKVMDELFPAKKPTDFTKSI